MLDTIRSAMTTAAALLVLAPAALAQDTTAPGDAPPPPAAAAAPATDSTAAKQPSYAMQKVVYHINTPGGDAGEAYRGAINNMGNHLDAVGAENIDLRVVLHGDGIELLQDAVTNQTLAGRISDLKARGVRFLVCNNTLTGRNIDPADLFEVFEDDIVPSGVAEVAKLQAEGFAYLKP